LFLETELTVRWRRKNILLKLELDSDQNSLTKFVAQNKNYLV